MRFKDNSLPGVATVKEPRNSSLETGRMERNALQNQQRRFTNVIVVSNSDERSDPINSASVRESERVIAEGRRLNGGESRSQPGTSAGSQGKML